MELSSRNFLKQQKLQYQCLVELHMPRKKKYLEVYLDSRLEDILEECLNDPNIKRQLITRRFREKASDVAKLAVYRFLEDMGKIPKLGRRSNNKES